MASRRSVVASTLASRPRRSTILWTRSREVRSLPASMSIREIVLPCSAGASRMSEHRLRVKTELPAPMRVILGTSASPFFEALSNRRYMPCPPRSSRALAGLLMYPRVLGAAGTAIGALLDPDLLTLHRQNWTIPMGDALGRTADVVADERAPKAVLAGVRLRAVYELAVEEEHVSWLHDDGHGLESFRHGHVVSGEGDFGIRLLRTE